MTTTLTRETESRAVAAPAADRPVPGAPIAAAEATVVHAGAAAVPETPAELLKQWAGDKPNVARALLSAIARCWAGLGGPAMTEQDRRRRDLAEAKGFADGYVRLA